MQLPHHETEDVVGLNLQRWKQIWRKLYSKKHCVSCLLWAVESSQYRRFIWCVNQMQGKFELPLRLLSKNFSSLVTRELARGKKETLGPGKRLKTGSWEDLLRPSRRVRRSKEIFMRTSCLRTVKCFKNQRDVFWSETWGSIDCEAGWSPSTKCGRITCRRLDWCHFELWGQRPAMISFQTLNSISWWTCATLGCTVCWHCYNFEWPSGNPSIWDTVYWSQTSSWVPN